MNCKICGKSDAVIFDGECIDCAPPPFPREKDWQAMYQSCVACLAQKTSSYSDLIVKIKKLHDELDNMVYRDGIVSSTGDALLPVTRRLREIIEEYL